MTKINALTLSLAALFLTGCPMPVPVTPEESPPPLLYEYEVKAPGGEEEGAVAVLPGKWATISAPGVEVRFRALAADKLPDETSCPCPVFAVTDHPEDPSEAPGEWCLAKSRTGQWMDAREHPRCQREARERKEPRP